MKTFKFLQTDFYQVAMGFAYVVEGLNRQKTAFEGFVRKIDHNVNPVNANLVFDGEVEVRTYIEAVRAELKDPELLEAFVELIEPKITAPNKDELIQRFRDNWKDIDTNFEYTVVPNGTVVFPFVPVFQYFGDKMVGQILETFVTNIYNGRTALATLTANGTEKDQLDFLTGIMTNEPIAIRQYGRLLEKEAKEFRRSTSKLLMEAGFRRAPSFETAKMASRIALENGWNGSSNVALLMGDNPVPAVKIGGTMAHSWVMCFEDEAEAYRTWDRIFPGTTMLIDTYDVVNAAKMIKEMIEAGEITAPREVRIDSDPLVEYTRQVNEIFGNTVGIYVSGDMSVGAFEYFNEIDLPFTKAMAGTKYLYSDDVVKRLNCGFVYKLVQFVNDKGETIRPEKKSTSKKNYPGLKSCSFDEQTNVLTVDCSGKSMGFNNMEKMTSTATVQFV